MSGPRTIVVAFLILQLSSFVTPQEVSQSPIRDNDGLEKIADGVNTAWNGLKSGFNTAVNTASDALNRFGVNTKNNNEEVINKTNFSANGASIPINQPGNVQIFPLDDNKNRLDRNNSIGNMITVTDHPISSNTTEKGFFTKIIDGIKKIFNRSNK